jgi:hypothetical protein
MSTKQYIKKAFFNSLKRGTGEAYILMRNYPLIDFSQLILKGACTNYAYDQQCEGNRAWYVFNLIKRSKQKELIISEVLKELQNKKKSHYDLDQMCDLAVYFYKHGCKDALEILFKRFDKNFIKGYDSCGTDQLFEIGGIKGLLKAAEFNGLYISKDNSENSYDVDLFQKKNTSVDAYKELKKASKRNKNIKAYYQSILEHQWKKPKKTKKVKTTYAIIKDKVENNKLRFIISSQAAELSVMDIKLLANDFINETNKQKKEMYLRVFAKRKYPFDYHDLLEIASRKHSTNRSLVEYAIDALQYFNGKDIRQLALLRIKKEKNSFVYLNLLTGTYKKGDCKLLLQLVNQSDNYDYIHSVMCGILNIYKANKTKECKEPLEALYNKTNCGIHRKDIISILKDNDVISETIINEIQFDSYEFVRDQYKKIRK